MKRQLIIIDPQIDFCKPEGSLFVSGADKDMERLATFVDRSAKEFEPITVTLDIHRTYSIFFTNFWVDKNGKNPNVFTIITSKDIENGTWTTSNPKLLERAKQYVTELDRKGRYPLCLWPRHCTWGSTGGAVTSSLFKSLSNYENDSRRIVNYVVKGMNPLSENYGCFEAEVPDPQDQSTMFNSRLIAVLNSADEIYVAGEALSHCVASSVRQMSKAININKITLLTDCTSNVGGFEKLGEDFITELTAKGMKLAKSTEVFI